MKLMYRDRPEVFFLAVIRIAVAIILAAHGWGRFFAGGVVPFGEWLSSLGFPGGFFIAAGITLFEITATPFLAFGKWVIPITSLYTSHLTAGILLVHSPNGWFVVGLSRNGMEFSVLLIICLVAIAAAEWFRKKIPA